MACPDGATAKHSTSRPSAFPTPKWRRSRSTAGTPVSTSGWKTGDRVEIHPANGSAPQPSPTAPTTKARPASVADAHLGGLARLMRMAGFDTLYDNGYADDRIEAIAVHESRIVLSRDRELLKRRAILHGCFPHAIHPPWGSFARSAPASGWRPSPAPSPAAWHATRRCATSTSARCWKGCRPGSG